MGVAVAVGRVVGMGVPVDGELLGSAVLERAREAVGVDVDEIVVAGCAGIEAAEAVALGIAAMVDVTVGVVDKHAIIPLHRLKRRMGQRSLGKYSFVLMAIPFPT